MKDFFKDKKIKRLRDEVSELRDENDILKQQIELYNPDKLQEQMDLVEEERKKFVDLNMQLSLCKDKYENYNKQLRMLILQAEKQIKQVTKNIK